MSVPSSWLPCGALDRAAVAKVLAGPLSDWSARWLARDAQLVVASESGTIRAAVAEPGSGVLGLRRRGALIEATLRPNDKRALIQAMLVLDPSDAALGNTDRQLLDMFVERAVDDLLALLEAGAPDCPGDGPARSIPLQVAAGREVLSLHCPDAFIVEAVRRSLARPLPDRGALEPRWAAAAREQVAIAARLGSAVLSLDELRGLSPGDILVMDRPLSAPIDVVVAASGRTIAKARLGVDHGERVLQFS